MFPAGVFPSVKNTLILAASLLACSGLALGQRHGGGHDMGGGGLSAYSRPDGVDEKDTLKDFHQALAVQATSRQIAAFQDIIKSTNSAKDKLNAFLPESGQTARAGVTSLDAAFETARAATKKFQQAFSDAQKSGLKDFMKRLEKADSDLGQEITHFDQGIEAEAAPGDLAARATSLNKSLAIFSDEQLALGREMGITLASGQDVAFHLPAVKHPVKAGTETLSLEVSGILSQSESKGDLRTFQLEMMVDVSDLQDNISAVMKDQLDGGRLCGERLAVKRATLVAASPASSLTLDLHFERWMCRPSSSPMELAEADGSAEMKLTPSIDTSNSLGLASEFTRVNASGMMGEELRSGDLGTDLRDKVNKSVLSVLRAAANLKTILPGAAQAGATLQTAKFQESGPGGLRVLLQGQVQMSNEQVNLLATQLNQTLSAQSTQPTPANPQQ